MAARVEWALIACLILFISGKAANKFNSITGSKKLIKSTSYHAGLTIAKLHRSKSAVGTCESTAQILTDSFDCSIFYVCVPLTPPIAVSFFPDPQRCPPGTCFNPTINQCDDVDCSCLPCHEEGTKLCDTENCAAYYICSSDLEPVHVICGEGQFYDAEKMGCFNPDSVNCGTRPGCRVPFKAYPNFQDCSSFYFCNATLFPLPSHCPAGECFNNLINACNKITATGCTVPC